LHSKGKVIAITGSNGKTTTTSMSYLILKSFFKDVRLGGNIGIPFSEITVNSTDGTIFVLELSSFQLEDIEKFRANTAVLLNLTPDHQDRYQRFEDYCKAKINVFKNQLKGDFSIINRFDAEINRYKPFIKGRKYFFSVAPHKCKGAYIKGDSVYLRRTSKFSEKLFDIKDLKVKGPHNLENAMAASLVGALNGVPNEEIRNALKSFEPLPHRLEYVATINGAEFYNDSKATNTDSVKKALLAFDKNIVLLLGGKDKGANFEELKDEVLKRCKRVVSFGAARNKVNKTFKGFVKTESFPTLKEAVKSELKNCSEGEIVLLSPACASFDEFKNFEDRGEKFKQWVRKGVK
ncbi:MAG: UDP-N-acetylmuramoyl-L-alanine--D-glutamate ligase, partial [Acidobacteria bacterium]|nr:UDP-N-acetylmuramoyl-L-alanine--D-glutamate ligase [Acidobacteriota bacterium]